MGAKHIQRIHAEPVVLDIGEDMGSLIIYTNRVMLGAEIEISPASDPSSHTHTDVAERRVASKTFFAAVYLPMPEGDYLIWGPDPAYPTPCAIVAGAITQLDWRSPSLNA